MGTSQRGQLAARSGMRAEPVPGVARAAEGGRPVSCKPSGKWASGWRGCTGSAAPPRGAVAETGPAAGDGDSDGSGAGAAPRVMVQRCHFAVEMIDKKWFSRTLDDPSRRPARTRSARPFRIIPS